MSDRFWDWYANSCYDELRRLRPYAEMQGMVADRLRLSPGERVVDLGCGTGNLLVLLAQRIPGASLTGLEQSPSMRRIAERKLGAKADIRTADLDQPLPFDDGAVDAAACVNVLYAVKDPAIVLREASRVLKPGGRLVAVNLSRPRLWWILRDELRAAEWTRLGNVVRELRTIYGFAKVAIANRVIQARAKKRVYHVWDETAFRAALTSAGFVVEQVIPCYGGTDLLASAHKPFV